MMQVERDRQHSLHSYLTRGDASGLAVCLGAWSAPVTEQAGSEHVWVASSFEASSSAPRLVVGEVQAPVV